MGDLAENLSSYGIDYLDGLDRVDGEADFYKRLAAKFLDNTQFDAFLLAMQDKDYDEAFNAIHALKGVSGNLSFNVLFHSSADVCDALRQKDYQAAEKLTVKVKSDYEKAIEGLKKWLNDEL